MKKQTVETTIILPVYNAERYLKQCIQSIVNQTYKDFELIVVDDASTDSTSQILKEFAKKDSRIQLHRNTANQGVAYTMNKAISFANGQYITIMNADDIMLPERLKLSIKFLKANPNYICTGTQVDLINNKDEVVGHKEFPTSHEKIYNSMLTINPVQHSSMTINKDLLPEDFTFYNNNYRVSEDLDLLTRLQKYGKLHNLPETLIQYRIHDESLTQTFPRKMFNTAYKIRINAITRHGYKPQFAELVKLHGGLILVNLLPQNLVNKVFYKLRGNLINK